MTPEEVRTATLAQAQESADPGDRAKVANDWHASLTQIIRDLARVRRQAVREMYSQGFSWAEIGHVLGVSRARAHQLGKGR